MRIKNKKLLTWCLVVCMVFTQMIFTSSVFAASTSRLSGSDRYETAVAIARSGWTTSNVVILATGQNFADALCAAPLARKNDAPILLTPSAKLDGRVKQVLTDLKVAKVIIVGGTMAVSQDIENEIKAMPNMQVQRISGSSRFETSVNIAKELGTFTEAALANAYGFADALSISSVAASKGMPILLTEKDAIPAVVKSFITGKTVYAIGGTGVISDAAANSVSAVRVSGDSRYATNAAVRSKFAVAYNVIYFATGENFADALAGAAIAAKQNGALVLVNKAGDYTGVTVNGSTKAYALGGTSAVVESVLTKIAADIDAAKAAEDAAAVAAAKTAAIKAATDAIAALPATITLANKTAVTDARTLVTAAKTNNGAADADFSNLSTLTAAETTIANLETAATAKTAAIKAATDAIAALPATITLANKTAVTDARALVTAAKTNNSAADADFSNLSKLTAAEATIKSLEDAAAAKANAIKAANDAIAALPATIALTDKALVESVRELVKAAVVLGAADADFTNLAKLTAAEAKIAELEASLGVVDRTEVKFIMPGVYVARIILKEGVTTADLTAKIGTLEMTKGVDVTLNRAIFFAQVNTASVTAVVTKTSYESKGTVTIPNGTLAGVVASTEMKNIMPGVYVARVLLADGATTTNTKVQINGEDMTAGTDVATGKALFFAQVSTATVNAEVFTVSTKTESFEIK